MPYATWENEDNRSGRMIVLPGMDHGHSKGQISCMMCVNNQKDVMSNQIWLESKRAVNLLIARIAVSMQRMFDHGGRFPETPKKKTHSEVRKELRKLKEAAPSQLLQMTKHLAGKKA